MMQNSSSHTKLSSVLAINTSFIPHTEKPNWEKKYIQKQKNTEKSLNEETNPHVHIQKWIQTKNKCREQQLRIKDGIIFI